MLSFLCQLRLEDAQLRITRGWFSSGLRVPNKILPLLACLHSNQLLQWHKLGRIDSCIARRAVSCLLTFSTSLPQAVQREVSERIGADVITNFGDRLICGDE